MSSEEIKVAVGELEVPALVHFTRSTNLPSIMAKGLLPRDRFESEGVEAEINDELRLDGRLDGTSLSIAFPNSRMLWKLRQDNPGVNWVVLGVNKSVLWELPCAFCKHNAADGKISCQPLETLSSIDALKGMYDEIEGFNRESDNLKTRLSP